MSSKLNENFAETILSKNAAVILTLDIDAKVQTASDAWCEQFGYTLEETIRRNFTTFMTPDSVEQYQCCEKSHEPNHRCNERMVQTSDLLTKGLRKRTFELHSAVDHSSDQIHKIITIIDVTETVRQRKALTNLAERDELTRLYSRRGFYKYMADGVRTSDMAMLLLDIDHFKGINDAFGHLIGDEYLKKIALKLNSIIGKDGLAA